MLVPSLLQHKRFQLLRTVLQYFRLSKPSPAGPSPTSTQSSNDCTPVRFPCPMPLLFREYPLLVVSPRRFPVTAGIANRHSCCSQRYRLTSPGSARVPTFSSALLHQITQARPNADFALDFPAMFPAFCKFVCREMCDKVDSMQKEEPVVQRKFAAHLRTRFLSGLLTLVPLVITLLVLRFVAGLTASFLSPLVRLAIGLTHPIAELVISLVGVALLVYVIGVITTHLLGRRFIAMGDSIILRIPVVKSIYAASKQMVDMFRSSERKNFKSVVLIPFPNTSVRSVGFVTGSSVNKDGLATYRVFVPTTPNPTTGFFLLIEEPAIQQTNLTVEDAIRMIMSGGMLVPEPAGPASPPSQAPQTV